MTKDKCSFRKGLRDLINCHSKENGSDTPDFILAGYLDDCLKAFDRAVVARDNVPAVYLYRTKRGWFYDKPDATSAGPFESKKLAVKSAGSEGYGIWLGDNRTVRKALKGS